MILMKNKICIPKKIVQFFCIFLLIIGFFILVNYLNKTILLSKNTLAYPIGQQTPTGPARSSECTNNPRKDCANGEIMRLVSGFCSCVSNKPSPISLPTANQNKRCVYVNNTSPTVIYPSRVEENKNGRWQSVENCLSQKICNPITFKCEVFTPKPLTGKKIPGSTCKLGLECQSGICDSRYMTPQGEYIFLPEKKCTYSLADQKKFMEQKLQNDRSVLQVGTATVAVLYAPAVGDAIFLKAISTAPVVYSFLEQPVVQKILNIMNVGGTAFSIADCIKNGAGGDLCQLYLGGVSVNPSEASIALENSVKNLFIKSALTNLQAYPINNYHSNIVGRKPYPEEIQWIKRMYGVDVIIADQPSYIPYLDTYAAGRSAVNSKTITLFPSINEQGQMEYQLSAALHEIGHATGAYGQVSITTMSDLFANECLNCRWTVNQLIKERGYATQSEEVLNQLDYMNKNARLFRQDAFNSLGLVNNNGKLVTGPQLANLYDGVRLDPSLLQYVNISSQNFSSNLKSVIWALGYR